MEAQIPPGSPGSLDSLDSPGSPGSPDDAVAARLARCTLDNTAALGLPRGRRLPARVLDVYDGDTLTAAAEVAPGEPRVVHVRLLGVDAPEMASRDPAERGAAAAAKARLVELLLGAAAGPEVLASRRLLREAFAREPRIATLVTAPGRAHDKYGRELCSVLAPGGGRDVAAALLAEGVVRRYDGGARGRWPTPPDGAE